MNVFLLGILQKGLGTVLTPVIPALWKAKAGGSPEVGSSRPAWPTWWNPVSTKNTKKKKISQVQWQAPVIPTTWEAEAGESLETGWQRLQWTEIIPLYSSLDNTSKTLSQKNKTKQKQKHKKSPKTYLPPGFPIPPLPWHLLWHANLQWYAHILNPQVPTIAMNSSWCWG